jgi:hypothetical protein
LKYKFKNLKEKQTTLCVDEMSLKTSLHFDKKKDRIIGIEDLGKDKKKNCGKASIETLMKCLWWLEATHIFLLCRQ